MLGFEVLESIIHCMEQLAVRGCRVRSECKPSPGAGASPVGCVDPRPDIAASVTVGIQLSSLFIRLQAAFWNFVLNLDIFLAADGHGFIRHCTVSLFNDAHTKKEF